MAETTMSLLLLFLYLISFTAANGHNNVQENKLLLHLQNIQWNYDLTGSVTQKSRSVKGSIILEMKHRELCYNFKHDCNRDEIQEKHLISDHLHVQTLQSRIKTIISNSNNNIQDLPNAEIPIKSGIKLQTLNYIVEIELGSRTMTMIVDTGSDITWIQCLPCKLCYNQEQSIFNPSTSSSYKSILCNSPTCQSLLSATGSAGVCGGDPPNACNYYISYGDGSYSRGVLGHERLKLGSTVLDNNIVFGCGKNNKGLFGGASGLMGLGRSDLSLISQTYDVFGGIFSYCLPDLQKSGSLVFGRDSSIYKNTTPISYANMVSTSPQLSTFYFLNLTGITIGGVVIKPENPTKKGILIDSGTIITRLVPSIYNVVRTEFVKQCSEFPTAPPFSLLDTCFNLSGYDEVNVPTLVMKFDGDAELVVDVTGVFYFVKSDASQVCLALASLPNEDEIMIIGNYQQKNIRVVYDTQGSKLGFAKEDCSFV